MLKILLTGLSVFGMATATCAQQKQTMNDMQSNSKILVAYFSATGTTARVAETLAKVTGGELYAIVPAEPYTNAHHDWLAAQSRSLEEIGDLHWTLATRRPKEHIPDFERVIVVQCCL